MPLLTGVGGKCIVQPVGMKPHCIVVRKSKEPLSARFGGLFFACALNSF